MVSAYCLTKHLEELTGGLDAQCGNLRFSLVPISLRNNFDGIFHHFRGSEYLEELDLYNFTTTK